LLLMHYERLFVLSIGSRSSTR